MAKEHSHAVKEVVLSSQNLCLALAVPVEAGTKHRLGEVEVWLVVSPLALSLNTTGYCVMAECLFLVAHLQQTWITLHQVANNNHGLNGELPVGVFLLAVLALAFAVKCGHRCAGEEWAVFVVVVTLLRLAVFLYPLHSLLELLRIIDAEVNAAQNLNQRYIFCTHAEILLQEVGINYRTGYSHTGVTHRQIALAPHCGHSLCSTRKAQNLFGYVGRYGVVVKILNIVTVNTESGQSLLCVSCQYGCQINRTRALCSVKAPNSLWVMRIHVHCLAAVAPARCNGDGTAHPLALEFLCTCSTLGYTTDGCIADNALNWTSVAIAQIACY